MAKDGNGNGTNKRNITLPKRIRLPQKEKIDT
jgi:hypothetical protein